MLAGLPLGPLDGGGQHAVAGQLVDVDDGDCRKLCGRYSGLGLILFRVSQSGSGWHGAKTVPLAACDGIFERRLGPHSPHTATGEAESDEDPPHPDVPALLLLLHQLAPEEDRLAALHELLALLVAAERGLDARRRLLVALHR